MTTRRIAVIGAGPNGMYCLERLAAQLQGASHADQPQVHIFEPHPFPGAGPVYDPKQPDYLRMNLANGTIDMWARGAEATGATVERDPSRPTFLEYLEANGVATSEAGYAPRRVVGMYLNDGFRRVISSLRTVSSVSVHPHAVHSIIRRDMGFEVITAAQSTSCDEVLLATGHGSRTASTLPGIAPYPIDQPGGVCDVAPGSAVAVRGLGLTAIDVALALTEGRGGRFVHGAMPGQVVYNASGLEPRTIVLYSRTGRPMVPQPYHVVVPDNEAVEAACREGSRMLAAIGATGTGSVFSALVKASATIYRHTTGENGSEQLMRQYLAALISRRSIDHKEPINAMRAAVETAYGRRLPGPEWALATAWRGVYPALVDLVATRTLDVCWSAFAALATEMQRVAFGPPAANAARLLALADAGIVDMSCAAGPELAECDGGTILRAGTTERRADVLVNAVLDPPGAAVRRAPLVASLLDAGLASTTGHSAGLLVGADGTCIGRNGQPTVGLAAVGRPTEGSILGNDSLSRRLHDTPARWAQATVERLGLSLASSAA